MYLTAITLCDGSSSCQLNWIANHLGDQDLSVLKCVSRDLMRTSLNAGNTIPGLAPLTECKREERGKHQSLSVVVAKALCQPPHVPAVMPSLMSCLP